MDEIQKKDLNTSFLVKDLIQGDESVAERDDYSDLDVQDIQRGLEYLMTSNLSEKQKKALLAESWRINYKEKPPTVGEFLTSKWIGDTANHIYPYIKDIIIDFLDPETEYRNLLLAAHIGFGKSFLTVLINLYIVVIVYLLRNPKQFYNLAPSTVLAVMLISFTLTQAKGLLLDPFINILETSDKFRRCQTEHSMIKKHKDDPSLIYWTTAGTHAMQFYQSVSVVLGSDPQKMLGLSILSGSVTEINFFIEKGFSPQIIERTYNDLKKRVFSRFSGQYLASTILDSSPNSIVDSPIDRYIFTGQAAKDPTNLIVNKTMWETQPHRFPIWQKSRETFPVFRGTGSRAPKILEDNEVPSYNPEEIFNVPSDARQMFEDDLLKSIKDVCAWPAGADDMLITNAEILNSMFTDRLKNIYKYIYAPADQPPEHLIWDQIKNQFFIKIKERKWEFYRNPREVRYISIDQSISGDVTGISMCHPENNEDGDIVFVIDFTIAIVPNKQRINLQAIECFIQDLRKLGSMTIGAISFDQFQSENTIQQLKRDNFDVEQLSVDKTMAPYLDFVSNVQNGRVKVGRNIFLKNNLLSLQTVTKGSGRKKIDHKKLGSGKVIEEDGADWNTSQMGLGQKDLSDAAAACVALCKLKYRFTNTRYYWEEASDVASVPGVSDAVEDNAKRILNSVRRKYKLQPASAR